MIYVLIILLGILLWKLILQNVEIKKLTKKLKKINENDTNEVLRISSPNKNLESFLCEINKTLKLKKSTEVKYKEMDLELRQAIANMSHDLRTPLTSIMGYIQLLEDDNILVEEKKEYIEIIENRSASLKGLISNFYDLSRLQANEYNFCIEKINISSILCNLLLGFYDEFERRGLEPKIDIDENIPLINGDKSATNRIFTNLIQNILKHAEGSLKIKLKSFDKYILTEFSNDAKELSEEDAKRIFERFFTVDRMRSGQNTGLGLAIARELIEKQGHIIYAKKDEDKLIISIRWVL